MVAVITLSIIKGLIFMLTTLRDVSILHNNLFYKLKQLLFKFMFSREYLFNISLVRLP